MRKTKVLIAVAISTLMSGGIFYACKKDLANQEMDVSMKHLKSMEDGITFIVNPHPVEKHLLNPEDIDDENINRQLYAIGMAARPFFMDNRLNAYIMEVANQHVNDCIDLREFREWHPITTGDYNMEEVEGLQNVIEATNLRYISKNPEVAGQVEQYIPALFVVNMKNADPHKMPIFCPGIDVNEDLPGMAEYEDHIIAWAYNAETGEFMEFLLNEDMALLTTHPIIIVDNACPELTKRYKSGAGITPIDTLIWPFNPPQDETVTPEMRRCYYSTHEYQINTRSEATGKSEFCVASVLLINGGSTISYYINGRPAKDKYYLIDKVAKGDIGKLRSKWVTFYSIGGTPFSSYHVYFNTFERDWARTQKILVDIPHYTALGGGREDPVYLYGHMKNHSDWYAYKPSEVKDNDADIPYIFDNWAKWHSNNNGKIRIWRIDLNPTNPIVTKRR